MKIALFGPENEFTKAMFAKLQGELASDTLLQWLPDQPPPDPALDAVLSLGKVAAADLDACPHLSLIQTVSDGYDAVDVDAATSRGIWVSFSPGDETGNADSVAEFAVLLCLAASRRLNTELAFVHDTSLPKPMINPSLLGKKVCIAGLGSIGHRIADRLRPFGVELSAVDRHPEHAPKDIPTRPIDQLREALGDQDYVVIALRGSEDNTHLFNADLFAAMKPGSTVVNISRGTLVDEAALFEAVSSGHLAAAGLDVLEHEPPQPTNPLLTLPQVFITPHIAGFTDLTLNGTAAYIKTVLAKFSAGQKFDSLLNHPEKPRHPLT